MAGETVRSHHQLIATAHHWSREKITVYRDEAQRILDALGRADAGAAQRLSTRIADYAAFCSSQAEQQ
ncbi:hypothetical protein [Vibrio vulnificus]|uniref:hypothetical protein n=1 Tax=Vibrio vulnificus TaxID=672 RepID=UPI0028A2FE41|nr:hypothetical protein [Vibrio vulnificus]HDY7831471.1 hypothetical protein [Vibrio vulnificus]